MSAGFAVDGGILLAGVLLIVGVFASAAAEKLRVPSLLLFLVLGMIVADDGLGLVRFDDTSLAQNIATVSLVIILFEGGLGTPPNAFREVGAPASLLATVGVVITAGVVAATAAFVLNWDTTGAMLVGAVVASTDAAAVFAALRSESLARRPMRILQLESGLNDPLAVLLTIGMIEVWQGNPTAWDWIWFLGLQIGAGIIVGIGVGLIAKRFISRGVRGAGVSLLGVASLAVAAVSYGLVAAIGGSGFLAVYLTGVVIATAQRRSRSVLVFHEGLAATAQGALFLLLGVLVFPSRLIDDIATSVVLAAVLIFVARPIAVFAVLSWWRMSVPQMTIVSWGGLRGAVPIVLATIPFTANHPDGAVIFDVTFVVVVLSVAIQAPTVGPLARRLGVTADAPADVERARLLPVDTADADLVELQIGNASHLVGAMLASVPPPDGARLAIIRRDGATLVPRGDTRLAVGDTLVVMAPPGCELDRLDNRANPPSD